MVKYPFYLGTAEVCVYDEAGFLMYGIGQSFGFQLVAERSRAAILPYYGVVYRLFGVDVPHYCSLTLVGNADGSDVKTGDINRRDGLCNDRSFRRPNLIGVVFNPSGLGKILLKLFLGDRTDLPFVVKDDGSGACCSLVKSETILLVPSKIGLRI